MTAKALTKNNLQPTREQASQEVGATIRRTVVGPFAPLLASLSGLEKEFPADDLRTAQLGHVIEMLESVRHGVEALVDLVAPDDQDPLPCTFEELARAALRALPQKQRGKIQLALENASVQCQIDGPRLSRSLSYVLLANVQEGREAIFHVKTGGNSGCFTLHIPPTTSRPEQTAPVCMHLQLVAEREIVRLGGSLECLNWEDGTVQLTVVLPLTVQTREPA
ncbi:MAG: hypothetical protein ACI9F9_002897 [Candidatus Paceibacteria bacterium]|jgi:hypothetical protein